MAREALAALDGSGLTTRQFAEREGISPQRLNRWRWRLSDEDVEQPAAAFLEVVAPGPARDRGVEQRLLEVVLPWGAVVRVPRDFEAETLRRLLEVLAGSEPC